MTPASFTPASSSPFGFPPPAPASPLPFGPAPSPAESLLPPAPTPPSAPPGAARLSGPATASVATLLTGQKADDLGFDPAMVPSWITTQFHGGLVAELQDMAQPALDLGTVVDGITDIGFRNVLHSARRSHTLPIPLAALTGTASNAASASTAPEPTPAPAAAAVIPSAPAAEPHFLRIEPGNPFATVPDAPPAPPAPETLFTPTAPAPAEPTPMPAAAPAPFPSQPAAAAPSLFAVATPPITPAFDPASLLSPPAAPAPFPAAPQPPTPAAAFTAPAADLNPFAEAMPPPASTPTGLFAAPPPVPAPDPAPTPLPARSESEFSPPPPPPPPPPLQPLQPQVDIHQMLGMSAPHDSSVTPPVVPAPSSFSLGDRAFDPFAPADPAPPSQEGGLSSFDLLGGTAKDPADFTEHRSVDSPAVESPLPTPPQPLTASEPDLRHEVPEIPITVEPAPLPALDEPVFGNFTWPPRGGPKGLDSDLPPFEPPTLFAETDPEPAAKPLTPPPAPAPEAAAPARQTPEPTPAGAPFSTLVPPPSAPPPSAMPPAASAPAAPPRSSSSAPAPRSSIGISAADPNAEEQLLLRALLGTDEFLSVDRIVEMTSELPGISACALIRGREVLADSASTKTQDSKNFRTQAPEVAQNLRALAPLIGISDAETFTLNTDSRLITLCFPGQSTLCILHDREPTLGLRDKLTLIARQLDRMVGSQA